VVVSAEEAPSDVETPSDVDAPESDPEVTLPNMGCSITRFVEGTRTAVSLVIVIQRSSIGSGTFVFNTAQSGAFEARRVA
jgi:hypothetical protein